MGPLLVADHCANLEEAKKLLRSMSVTLGSISRHYRSLITSDDIISMTATLHDLASRRNVCLGNLDERSEAMKTKPKEDTQTNSDAAEFAPPRVAHSEVDHIANEEISDLAKEPEEIAAPAKIVEASGFGKVETPAMVRASDDATKEATAANAETRAAAKPPKNVSKLINFFNKRSTAGYQNPEVIEKGFVDTPDAKPPHKVSSLEMLSTIGKMSSRLSHSREKKQAEMSNAPKLLQSMAKERDPPWFKPVVPMVASTTSASKMIEMLRQEAQSSAPTPTPKNEKTAKAFSATRNKILLDLQMPQMMSSLGSEPCLSSLSTMGMANLLMRASLLMMFSASARSRT